ncbi:MAG: helix-turn-helix domain-containing protein [Treponema sp.]|nr:helix-turn-helix domain-containing protein [Treponema sp.]
MSFRDNLKEAMFIANITTKELAAKTGIKEGTISNYLKNKGSLPNIKAGTDLANALNVSVNFLVYGYDEDKVKSSSNTVSLKYLKYSKTINQLDSLSKEFQSAVILMVDALSKNN